VHGHLKVTCQGKTVDVRTGDTFVVRGGVEHGASAMENSRVIDVFTPCREDYIS
jgi:quercetin dioxygenase-like cupin family protein